MSERVAVVWDDDLTRYNFGRGHPMAPIRVELTMRLARAFGTLAAANVEVVAPGYGSDDLLTTVHTPELLQAVRRCGDDPSRLELDYGLGSDDNPCFAGMHDASARVAAGTVEMADAVVTGRVDHGVNIIGGLHHAMPERASGFCIYNDIALGIRHLLEAGVQRVAYVDVDVHHGDGVQHIFYDDPRVLTISMHETPRTLFPGTGYPEETGGPNAPGSAVNIALPPGTNDAGWLRAFDAVVPHVLREFGPEVLVTQHGCDSHAEDPLAHMALTVDGQRMAYQQLHDLAHELCEGRWVVTGGGGYAVVDVVPRAWTHLLAIVAGAPIDPQAPLPESWRSYVNERLGRAAPYRMTDGATPSFPPWENGYDPGDWLDRAVLATRKAIFPLYGLDPHW
jgi:acetoin utilization protein AcuC